MPYPPKHPKSRSRRKVFTWNNYEQGDIFHLLDQDSLGYQFIEFQQEKSKKGTPHLQGWIVFETVKANLQVSKNISEGVCHVESMVATDEENHIYCTKESTLDGERFSQGERPVGQGARTDVTSMVNDIKTGTFTERQLAEKYGATYLRTYKGVAHMNRMFTKPKPYEMYTPPPCMVFYGDAGTGKTHGVKLIAIEQKWSVFFKTVKNAWEAYRGEQVVVMDDFRGKWMEHHELLTFLDNNSRMVHNRYFDVDFNPELIIFTANKHPYYWYRSSDPNEWAQLKRRLPVIRKQISWGEHINGVDDYGELKSMEVSLGQSKPVHFFSGEPEGTDHL